MGDDVNLRVTAGWNDEPVDLAWCAEHHGHELYAQDEYDVLARNSCERCKAVTDTRPIRIGYTAVTYYCETCQDWAEKKLKEKV